MQYIVADLVLRMCPEWLLEVSVSKYILVNECVHLCVCVCNCVSCGGGGTCDGILQLLWQSS